MCQLISDHIRSIWRGLPIRIEHKLRAKQFLFEHFPIFFQWSSAYRNWQRQNSLAAYAPSAGRPFSMTEATDPKAYFVPFLDAPPLRQTPARLIAFYLPQFHAIPENNRWWGEGFTEWTNVRPAQPQFQGHYQPHVPADLGYYDLLEPGIQRKQVELAKTYGIEGFCFYFYWFAGKRLLETPVLNYLNDPSLDLPFCLCWANENWSRRWDGLHNDILIAQQHSAEDDFAFIEHVAQYLRDPRYIRINGKPLLLVYRPTLLPSSKKTAKRWRDWCRANGIGEIYLAYTQSFEMVKPDKYGYDAAIEFPPNLADVRDITEHAQPLEGGNFVGKVFDWTYFVRRSHQYDKPRYKLFRGVCPSWDNTARRKNRGTVFVNNTPALYRMWLANAIQDTQQRFADPDERLVFINAWNEWAEGAHLEPDARYGYAWLQATRDALVSRQEAQTGKAHRVVVVTHDAYPHGAQYLALNMVRELTASLGCEVEMVCLGNGPLLVDFAAQCRLHELAGLDPQGSQAAKLAADLFQRGFRHALVNTTVSGLFLKTLKQAGLNCVALVHELREVIVDKQLQPQARMLAEQADRIVFPAPPVWEAFAEFAAMPEGKATLRPQGLYKRNRYANANDEARRLLREELGLPADAKILLGLGYADHRKGVDHFVAIAARLAAADPLAHAVWVGHWEAGMQAQLAEALASQPNIHFIGRRDDTSVYYAGADVFALTSREDPFPSVVLEAMDAGLPTVAFQGSGGSNALLDEGAGVNVAMGDTEAFAQAVRSLFDDAGQHAQIARRGRELIAERFSFRHYLYDLLGLAGLELRKISVVVPNYNYERYLPERLSSIIGQSHPVYEILFLDDASTDNSLAVASKLLADSGIDYRIIANAENSGSVFAQWRRGVEQARGDIVWIAEADDLSHPAFLQTVQQGFDDPNVALAYCESKQIDGEARVLADNYHDYVADLGVEHWLGAYVNAGEDEIRDYLAVKNTIPNVSGVLMRRDKLFQVLDKHFDDITRYRVAGDWKTYLYLLAGARLAFYPQSLNLHRRHAQGVTISRFDASQLREIQDIQQWVAERDGLGAETQAMARQYLAKLSAQFNVPLSGP